MTDHRAKAVALLGHVTIDTAAIVHAMLHFADTWATIARTPDQVAVMRAVDLTAPEAPREDYR